VRFTLQYALLLVRDQRMNFLISKKTRPDTQKTQKGVTGSQVQRSVKAQGEVQVSSFPGNKFDDGSLCTALNTIGLLYDRQY